MTQDDTLLEVSSLAAGYGDDAVLRDLSFTVDRGRILGIVGESGCGKTTLLRALAGLLAPQGRVTAGSIRLEGREITRLAERELRRLRGSTLGWIAQDPGESFCPVRTLGSQMLEAAQAHEKTDPAAFRRRALELFAEFGFDEPERVWASRPYELSGGMNQRVGVTTALLLKPRLILADEPTSALDADAGKRVLASLRGYCRATGAGLVLVSHDLGAIARAADTLLVMKDGTVLDAGEARTLLEHPEHPYTRELVEATPRLVRSAA